MTCEEKAAVRTAAQRNEGRIIQARQQVREMAQDAPATLYEIAPGAHRTIDPAAGYAVFSTLDGDPAQRGRWLRDSCAMGIAAKPVN